MRVLIADDHKLVLDALRAELLRSAENGEDSVTAVETLDQALEAADRPDAYDIVLLDFMMPGMNGLEGLQRMMAQMNPAPVAVISGAGSPDLARKIEEAGAAGYVPKTLGMEAIVAAVREIAAGKRFFPRLQEDLDPKGQRLTRRERQVLSYLYQGLQNKEIARLLDLQEVTVKLHVRSLCRKLEVANRTQAAMRGQELGIAPVL